MSQIAPSSASCLCEEPSVFPPAHRALRRSLSVGIIVLLCWQWMGVLSAQQPEQEATSGDGLSEPSLEVAGNEQVAEILRTFQPRGVMADGSQPTPPEEAVKTFHLKDGVEIELVAAEPVISQPLHVSWDSQGRLWVVQYRQYQYPAGLKVVRFDQHLRAVFDRLPAPPPYHVPGKDVVTVLEDTDGDGRYDAHRDVITGLNIATSVAVGQGGIWVLNPPYLLFYPDADGDAVPDTSPEVHLRGFGLQDTHSVANNLTWGPDGWLYGANGSTTAGTVSSAATPGIEFAGQCIWRYHPTTHVFEIYAEGGGNTFSLEIDAAGRVFSGHNGGNTRGWYHPQGSYSAKNWGKHGPLTNPYAFGYFHAMPMEGDPRRFAQAFAIYEGGLFPADTYQGTIIAPNSLQNLVWHSRRLPHGSTFRTVDLPNLLESTDRWFRPVHVAVGPDGAIYLADWYDTRLSHVSPLDDWHKESGRIYRLFPSGRLPRRDVGDLTQLTATQLIALLDHDNKWVRRQAALELGWRKLGSAEVQAHLFDQILQRGSVDALWALHLVGGLTSERAGTLLQHRSADVRRCVVRLLGDRHEGHPALVDLAAVEPSAEVRSQLAASARRVDAGIGLAIIGRLLGHDNDVSDPHLPLMVWWAVESHAEDFAAITQWLADSQVWQRTMMRTAVTERLMRRYAAAGRNEDLQRCVRLLQLAPTAEDRHLLVAGFYKAYQGRTMPPLPPTLAEAMEEFRRTRGNEGLILAIAQGDTSAVQRGLELLRSADADVALRIEVATAFGRQPYAPAADALLALALGQSTDEPALRRVALQALAAYEAEEIGHRLAAAFAGPISAEYGLRDTACRTLAARASWATALLNEINQWRVQPTDVPPDVVQRLRTYQQPELVAAVEQAFGKAPQVESPAQTAHIKRLLTLVRSRRGDAERGREVFRQRCGVCHRLFGEGETIGPPLDHYDRQNLEFWLTAIVVPSAEIREGFQSYLALTTGGRVVTGMVAAQDVHTITLRTADSQLIVLPRDQLEEFRAIDRSLMPDNILDSLDDAQIVDLFAYLTQHAR
ncbi:MAG: L-sorbosone dehydrogenase [Pirellulaceae bacterium]|nr:MAG: L-sorbosone dehydrogenase [Pirellulaceae bacterium]